MDETDTYGVEVNLSGSCEIIRSSKAQFNRFEVSFDGSQTGNHEQYRVASPPPPERWSSSTNVSPILSTSHFVPISPNYEVDNFYESVNEKDGDANTSKLDTSLQHEREMIEEDRIPRMIPDMAFSPTGRIRTRKNYHDGNEAVNNLDHIALPELMNSSERFSKETSNVNPQAPFPGNSADISIIDNNTRAKSFESVNGKKLEINIKKKINFDNTFQTSPTPNHNDLKMLSSPTRKEDNIDATKQNVDTRNKGGVYNAIKIPPETTPRPIPRSSQTSSHEDLNLTSTPPRKEDSIDQIEAIVDTQNKIGVYNAIKIPPETTPRRIPSPTRRQQDITDKDYASGEKNDAFNALQIPPKTNIKTDTFPTKKEQQKNEILTGNKKCDAYNALQDPPVPTDEDLEITSPTRKKHVGDNEINEDIIKKSKKKSGSKKSPPRSKEDSEILSSPTKKKGDAAQQLNGKAQASKHKKKKTHRMTKSKTKRLKINCQKLNLPSYSELASEEQNLSLLQDDFNFIWSQRDHKTAGTSSQRDYNISTYSSTILHEIRRANWTWCTEWSPDGKRLALASENNPLAIIDTSSTLVWKFVYNIHNFTSPLLHPSSRHKKVPFSIRAIAWGQSFIAIGGTGDLVSIIDGNSCDYPVLHTIAGTGFVGSLQWRPPFHSATSLPKQDLLAMGNRSDQMHLVNVTRVDGVTVGSVRRENWVNGVAFSPNGKMIAVGDQSGKASVYKIIENGNTAPFRKPLEINLFTDYWMEDSILFVEWTPCGKWLFLGGEDFGISIVDTSSWNVVKKLCRDLWVNFAVCSHTGTHVAVGGGVSKVNVFDVGKWSEATTTSFDGKVVLSAKWHPKDLYLSISGQDEIVKVLETTSAHDTHTEDYSIDDRHPGLMRFSSGIESMDVSPDGKYLVVGKEEGVVSFIDLNSSGFSNVNVVYEIFVAGCFSYGKSSNSSRVGGAVATIQWSPNGRLVAIGGGNTLMVFDNNDDIIGPFVQNSFFSINFVMTETFAIEHVSFSPNNLYMVVSGQTTKVYDLKSGFKCVNTFSHRDIISSSWSPDGTLLALKDIGEKLAIFDTSYESVNDWRIMFELSCDSAGTALSWGSSVGTGSLYYLAYGGEGNKVTIIEIRTVEESWEVVLDFPCHGHVLDLHWRFDGILAVATENGTANIVDLAYLLSGTAVNEMNYNWQRQGVTCSLLLKRRLRQNSMNALRWLGPMATEDHILIIGGSDGIVETINFNKRKK